VRPRATRNRHGSRTRDVTYGDARRNRVGTDVDRTTRRLNIGLRRAVEVEYTGRADVDVARCRRRNIELRAVYGKVRGRVRVDRDRTSRVDVDIDGARNNKVLVSCDGDVALADACRDRVPANVGVLQRHIDAGSLIDEATRAREARRIDVFEVLDERVVIVDRLVFDVRYGAGLKVVAGRVDADERKLDALRRHISKGCAVGEPVFDLDQGEDVSTAGLDWLKRGGIAHRHEVVRRDVRAASSLGEFVRLPGRAAERRLGDNDALCVVAERARLRRGLGACDIQDHEVVASANGDVREDVCKASNGDRVQGDLDRGIAADRDIVRTASTTAAGERIVVPVPVQGAQDVIDLGTQVVEINLDITRTRSGLESGLADR